VKVAPRITIATGLIVAVAMGSWAWLDWRAADRHGRAAFEREARLVAQVLRTTVERGGATWLDAPVELAKELSRNVAPWRVVLAPLDPGGIPLDDGQRQRLAAMVEAPRLVWARPEGDQYVVALPVRLAAPAAQDGIAVVGMLELSRPLAHVEGYGAAEPTTIAALVVVVAGVTTLAVGLLMASLMSRPVAKLLRGIDDVARGDLSHALLSERDDEIGALATRFNEMTYSLRESRAETLRQNEAKLELEQRLSHTEKLATIGQIAAEIAHEVGTPLGVIGGRARAIQKRVGDPEAVEKNAQIIAEQTARITRIIQRLLDFSRRRHGTQQRAPVNLNELALTTMELLSSQFASARVRTTLDRAEGLPRVASADADRLQQVLLNLLLNALQAMPDGGALRVETSAVVRQRPGLELSPEQPFVRLDVIDSGVGIPPEVREKIFEPFFTTRDGKGGTGLGLSVCFGIVKEHDGWIELDDAPGGGTVFRVFLPAA
jgi:signal transduction histidine kinase